MGILLTILDGVYVQIAQKIFMEKLCNPKALVQGCAYMKTLKNLVLPNSLCRRRITA